MKKLVLGIIATIMLSLPSMHVFAGSGDTAAGAAVGLVGGMMLGRAMDSSGRHAKRDVEQMRREQQQKEMTTLERRVERQHMIGRSRRTMNLLLFAIILLFLGLVALGVIVLKKK
jgi:Na+/glutamate symporter